MILQEHENFISSSKNWKCLENLEISNPDTQYKGFCQKYKPKEKNPSQCHWGSKLLAGVHLTNQGSTTNPKKSKSGFPPPPCQVSETPELTEVVRQFIEANRAPRDVETDF